MLNKKINIILLFLILLLSFLVACKKDDKEEQEEPTKYDLDDLSVRDYVSKNGIVTAANPYAANVGIEILKKGGNAFDASVAVAFALGVCEMDASGIGGGGLMIAYNVNTKNKLYYNFREFASKDVSTDLHTYDEMGDRYCLYTAVPTELAGLVQILKDQGTMKLSDVIAPAIKLAKEGVVCTPELIANINDNSTKINRNEYLKDVFKRENGSRLKAGDKIYQNDLANTLQAISDNGIEYFYQGEFADKIINTINTNGGVISKEDMVMALNKNYLDSSKIITGTYKNYDLITVGSPSTGGTMLVEMLNMIEASEINVKELGHNTKEYLNLLATIMQLAYGDKQKYLADSNFVDVPLKGILSKDYARERISKYKTGSAYLGCSLNEEELPYGDPYKYDDTLKTTYEDGDSLEHCSTTSFSVVDKEGNMVTFTQTINNFFGSGISVPGTGFFLNDQMKDFSYEEGSINVIEPLKQPASYMLPTVVLKEGKPYATFGTPGGSRIPSAGLQVFLNMVEFDMNMQDAINAYRIYCFTTSEADRNKTKKVLYIEVGLNSLKEELNNMGYEVNVYGDSDIHSYFGGVQGIKVEGSDYHGGADPRRDGKALGY